MNIRKTCLYALMTMLFPAVSSAQSVIPSEYRGTQEAIARGILNGNNIETNFRNHGEIARWGDEPWGKWYTNRCDRFDVNCTFKEGTFIDGVGFFVAGRVTGERVKWGIAESDTTLNPVIINYRQAGLRSSPYSGKIWGWFPIADFNNANRTNNLLQTEPIPAISTDETSWPEFWPNKLKETSDAGWGSSWNGFRGKGLVTGDEESFYVMDDFSDKEYAYGEETEGPHSSFGVYYPSPSDSSIGGLGIQTEVRTFQFNNILSRDILFTQYRITNVSEKDIQETWASIMLDVALSSAESNMSLSYNEESDALIIANIYGDFNFSASFAFLVLEHSFDEENRVDDDQDGIIDESKFNGPGELIEGKAAIDAYLEANYNMELFRQKHISLEEFPAYQNEHWWTGDEDLDWVAFDDHIANGVKDEGEDLIDDVGRDGLGPNHENYPGPDEGEGDGIPTQGEPNFGEQDMLEAENRGLGNFDLSTRTFYESGNNLRDDTWLFGRVNNGSFEEDKAQQPVLDDEPFFLAGTGSFKLKKESSSYFTTAIVFAESVDSLTVKIARARAIYESDYGQSPFLTIPISNEEEPKGLVPYKISLSQNYPNPFNPTTNIEFSLTKTAPVSLTVFDITGREVQSLISNTSYSVGTHSVHFDAGNLSSGVYIYRLEAAGEVFTKKLTLIK